MRPDGRETPNTDRISSQVRISAGEGQLCAAADEGFLTWPPRGGRSALPKRASRAKAGGVNLHRLLAMLGTSRTVLPRPAGAFFTATGPAPQSSCGFTAGAFRLAMAVPSASRVKRLRCINFNFVARLFAPLGEALRCCAFVLALLLHRGLARNDGELRRRALERLPGLRPALQVSGDYLVDQRPRRVVRRDHPMQ